MNTFELKKRLKKVYPNLNGSIVNKIITNTEFINTDIQTLIDRSVSSVKDLFTVRTIDDYAKKLATYTQDFLDKLDKLKVHWLISHNPTGLNFYSDELKDIFSEPFAVKSAKASSYLKQLRKEGKNKTFIIHGISEVKWAHSEVETDIRGTFVRKSIYEKIYVRNN